jgi:hemerythrin-like domain-containing protein
MRSRAVAIESLPENLLKMPLDLLLADHYRQILICDMLDGFVEPLAGPLATEERRAVRDYLELGLQQHIADEDEDLAGHLRVRCGPEDRIDELLAELAHEHAADEDMAGLVAAKLDRETPFDGETGSEDFTSTVIAFTLSLRRHLAWENGTLLPLTRERLNEDDLRSLADSMAARRGHVLSW